MIPAPAVRLIQSGHFYYVLNAKFGEDLPYLLVEVVIFYYAVHYNSIIN